MMKHVNLVANTKITLVTMMRTNDATYTELIALRDNLDARRNELHCELEDVSRKLESVSTTLALLDGSSMPIAHRLAVGSVAPINPSIDIASLRGMKQIDALTKIAQHGGGQLRTTIAKKLLLQAGLISNPKNANNIMFSVIQRSGKFERVEPGVYRLIGDKPEKPERLLALEGHPEE